MKRNPRGLPVRISQLVGDTPLMELPIAGSRARLLLKLEKFNPAQSMKDRMALGMIEDAEHSGRLAPGGTIVESSSGNTGTALAMMAAERGYPFIVVVDQHAAREKVRAMRAYGATVVEVGHDRADDEVATALREARAAEIAETIAGAVYLRQADNPANGASYESTLARELVEGVAGPIDVLVGAVGTGGSLSGTARAVKATHGDLYVVGVEPLGSIIFGGIAGPYYQSGTGTPGGVEVGRNVDYAAIDEGRTVGDREAFAVARVLARRRGLLVGGSAGGVIHIALDYLHSAALDHTVVAILADGGEKYLDTVFDDEWMSAHALLDPGLEKQLWERLAAE